MEHRPLACALSGFLNPVLYATRAKDYVSGVQLRWAHRLEVCVPIHGMRVSLPKTGS
jgi:hypothetical protein